MSEIAEVPSAARHRRQSGRPIHLDMTPMVDLAFLLLTFFILTTTMVSTRGLVLDVPAKGPPAPLPQAKALTLLVCEHNRLFWYQGTEEELTSRALHVTGYRALSGGLRSVLQHWQKAARDTSCMMVLIKTANKANYKNLVDVLDAMMVAGIHRYALADPSAHELALAGSRGK